MEYHFATIDTGVYIIIAAIFLNNIEECVFEIPVGFRAAPSVNSGEAVNITVLVEEFILVCGSNAKLCHPENSSYKFYYSECLPRITSCKSKCAMTQSCPPDADTAYLSVFCVSTDIYPTSKHSPVGNYMVVNSHTKAAILSDVEKRCSDLDELTQTNLFDEQFRPVISTQSKLTYRNKFCAYSYGDMDLIPFKLQLLCNSPLNINSFSSLQELLNAFKSNACNVSYAPPDEMQLEVQNCSLFSRMISRCNETGLWRSYNYQIDWACDNFNSFVYKRYYKNVFCYICNPSLVSTRERNIIDTCNVTGKWLKADSRIEEGCLLHSSTNRTFPFKNKFCQVCNGYSTFQRNYTHLSVSGVSEYRYGERNYTAMFHNVKFHGFKLGDNINRSCILSRDAEVNNSQEDGIVSNAAVQYDCGFEAMCIDTKTAPYLNTYIQYLFPQCSDPCRPHKKHWGPPIPAYKADRNLPHKKTAPESQQYFGNRSLENDFYAQLAVQSEITNLVYKNIYCARQLGDIHALLTPRLTVSCDNPLEASLAVEFNEILHIAKENHCEIRTRFHCTADGPCIKSCVYRHEWLKYNKAVVQLCENSFLVQPVIFNATYFKNLFCVMCYRNWNIDADSNIIAKCIHIGKWHMHDELLEDKCLNGNSSADWYPFKNMFCAICNTALARNTGIKVCTISDWSTFRPTVPISGSVTCYSGFSCFLTNVPYRILFTLSDLSLYDNAVTNGSHLVSIFLTGGSGKDDAEEDETNGYIW